MRGAPITPLNIEKGSTEKSIDSSTTGARKVVRPLDKQKISEIGWKFMSRVRFSKSSDNFSSSDYQPCIEGDLVATPFGKSGVDLYLCQLISD